MQEIKIISWCDRCGQTGVRREAEQTLALSLPGHADRELDLCSECLLAAYAPLATLVAEASRPAERSAQRATGAQAAPAASRTRTQPSPDQRVTCPVCFMTSSTQKGFSQHYRAYHRITSGGTFVDLLGTKCFLCGEQSGNLVVHLRRSHQISSLVVALERARAEGDPHGALAELEPRLAALREAAPQQQLEGVG